MSTTHALYCATCGQLVIGGELDDADVQAFAWRHPETKGHAPRLSTLDEARDILQRSREQGTACPKV